jgi:four helix bundle protein
MGSILKDKTYAFALRTVKLCRYLVSEQKEYVLSKQVLRSGTAIGALVAEAEFAQSKPDFINKLSVALKEANETSYWLNLLRDGDYISKEAYASIHPQVKELIKLLVSSIKTSKDNIKAGK